MRSPESLPLGGKVPSECEADEGAGCHPLCRAAISRPLRKLPSSLRRGAMWPPVEVSAPCRAREGELPCKGKRDWPEPRLSAPRTSAGRPVSGPYEKGGTASVYAVGAAHRAARPAFPLPGGRCPSAHTGADEGGFRVHAVGASGKPRPQRGARIRHTKKTGRADVVPPARSLGRSYFFRPGLFSSSRRASL